MTKQDFIDERLDAAVIERIAQMSKEDILTFPVNQNRSQLVEDLLYEKLSDEEADRLADEFDESRESRPQDLG